EEVVEEGESAVVGNEGAGVRKEKEAKKEKRKSTPPGGRVKDGAERMDLDEPSVGAAVGGGSGGEKAGAPKSGESAGTVPAPAGPAAPPTGATTTTTAVAAVDSTKTVKKVAPVIGSEGGEKRKSKSPTPPQKANESQNESATVKAVEGAGEKVGDA
ncbi:hypothetical protein HK102_002443, partial [Quaeritorhiza haematococci]